MKPQKPGSITGLLHSFYIAGDKTVAKEILKDKYLEISKLRPVNRGRYNNEGKLVLEEAMELYDFWGDLPFIDRLSKQFDINLST